MKKRIFLLVACAFVFFGCSEEESIEELEIENVTTISDSNEVQSSNSVGTVFICYPNWIAPIFSPNEVTLPPEIIHITYTDEIALEDIDCIRQEYFRTYGCLRMARLQPTNPRYDVWIDLLQCPKPTGSGTTGQTVPLATAPEDDRVCMAPPSECD